MPITLSDLVLLRKKLDLDRKKIEERERAISTVERMLREEASTEQRSLDLPAPVSAQPRFGESVRNAVVHFGTEQFTVPDIEALMKRQNVPLPRKNPRPRIAMILQRLVTEGAVVRTIEGKGPVPNSYRIKGNK
jgi:hypothetical protein